MCKEINSYKRKMPNNIRENCFIHFIKLSSKFINGIETYKKELRHMIKTHDLDSLNYELINNKLINSMVKDFYERFDIAFLHFYPHFILKVNQLMLSDKQFTLKHKERMNTELRMLALIKLGILECTEISSILHLSAKTVYSYRSRLKAHAISPVDFEENIKKIH